MRKVNSCLPPIDHDALKTGTKKPVPFSDTKPDIDLSVAIYTQTYTLIASLS